MHSWQCKTWHLGQWEKQPSLHQFLCSSLLQALQTNNNAKIQGGARPHQKEGGDTMCPTTAGSGAVTLSNRHHPEPMELQVAHYRSLLLIAGLCLRFWSTVTFDGGCHVLFARSTVSGFMTMFSFLFLHNQNFLTQANSGRKKEGSPKAARQSWGTSTFCHPLLKVLKLPTSKLAWPPSTAL